MVCVDLTEFLTARYDEEQALADAATPGPWAVGGELLAPFLPRDFVHAPHYKPEGFSQGQHVGDASVADGGMGPWAVSVRGSGFPFANAQHIAAHDPARVLADLAAKRGLLALHKVNIAVEGPPPRFQYAGLRHIYQEGRRTYWCDECDHDRDYGHIDGPDEGCRTLRLLAAPYAEHPDYDAAWKIDD